MNASELEKKPLTQLRLQAKELNIERSNRLKKEDLIIRISQELATQNGEEVRGGIL